MEKVDITCIGCPMGCQVTVELEGKEVLSVSGNSCPIGDTYARKEVSNPERTVTSTVFVEDGEKVRVSVKTASNIPKAKINECMEAINKAVVKAPVAIGDVVIENVAGTGVNVIATRNVGAA